MTRLRPQQLVPALAAACLSLVSPWLIADSPRPEPERGVVRRFDFEERKLGNFEEMPRDWTRITSPEFPAYCHVGFDDAQSVSGQHSLRLQLDGGSAAAQLSTGVIACLPGAHYRIAARVRTHHAAHARARLTAWMVDQDGKTLPGTGTSSTPIATGDRWALVVFDLPDAPPAAAWLRLRVELLQPDLLDRAPAGPHELIRRDIDAAAWFDDVTVYQLPRIRLTVPAPGHVVRQPDHPRLMARVDDLSTQGLTATLRLIDPAGRVVAQQQRPLDSRHPGTWEWDPPLDKLGWYAAELRVGTATQTTGRSLTAFAWLPPPPPEAATSEPGAFTLLADDVPAEVRSALPELLKALPEQGVAVSAWPPDLDAEHLGAWLDRSDPVLMQLFAGGRPVTLAFTRFPRQIAAAAGTDADRPLDLLSRDPKYWTGCVQTVLARYGQQARGWRIGPAGSDEAADRTDLAAVYARLAATFHRYVSGARVSVPWSAQRELTPTAAKLPGLLMRVPVSVEPQHLPDYAATWRRAAGPITCDLQTLEPGRFSSDDRAADLALRMIEAWRVGIHRLSMDLPWVMHGGAADTETRGAVPDVLLPVWVNVSRQLSGRRSVGRMSLAPGVECELLEEAGGRGVLAVWNRGGGTSAASLDLYLGSDPVAVDIWGNRHPLRRVGDKQQLTVTAAPQFIEGIDLGLARFRAGFAITPTLAESTQQVHHHTLELVNPWPRTITGRVRITGPDRWDFQPRLLDFVIPAGERVRLPVSFTFPLNQPAGRFRVTARVEVDSGEQRTLAVDAPIEVGLPDVSFQSALSVDRTGGARDVIATVIVTNLGDADASYYVFATAPDRARRQRIISLLKPGQTVVKQFRFTAAASFSGQQIRVGLRQTDGPAVLNHILDVP